MDEWKSWDRFYSRVEPEEHAELLRRLERRKRTDAERAANAGKDYDDFDEMDETVELINPPPPRPVGAYNSSLLGGGPVHAPIGDYRWIAVALQQERELSERGPPPAGDQEEENLRLNPWEMQQIPNPVPAPPTTYTPWSNWPAPTCPPQKPGEGQILPNYFMLLCPDGLRRDHVGNFGMDSLLAKIKNRRQIAFRNYCVISRPGRLGRLTFEVVDSGFNRVVNRSTAPLLVRMGFMYHVLNTDDELTRYL